MPVYPKVPYSWRRLLLPALLISLLAAPAGAELPPEVAEALEAGECTQLMRLNRRYWRLAEQEDAPDAHRRAALLLEDKVLSLPLCGRAEGELLQVMPLQGVDFFAPYNPAGLAEPEALR